METNDNRSNLKYMAVNIHVRKLDHVVILAQIEANKTGTNQVIYKTKDQQNYDIYKFVQEKGFKGITVRVVRYTREDKHETVLQDSGNKQLVTISKKSGSSKTGKPRTAK